MARIITGTRPKMEIKKVTQSVDPHWMDDIEDILRHFKMDNDIPAESEMERRQDDATGLFIYTWTWYEITI